MLKSESLFNSYPAVKGNLIQIIAGLVIAGLSVFSAINYPQSFTLIVLLIIALTALFSYKYLLAAGIITIAFVIEGDFILHIGLGLKIKEGFTIHPIDFLFAFVFFLFILKQFLQHNLKVYYPKVLSWIIVMFCIISFVEFVRGVNLYGFKNSAWDARYYFYFLSFFIAYEFLDNENKWRATFKIILITLAMHSLLLLSLSIIRDTGIISEDIWLMSYTEMGVTGRVGSSNTSFFIILWPLLLFFRDWIIKQRLLTNFQWWLVAGCFVISFLIGMGRATLFLMTVNFIILTLVRPKYIPKVGLTIVAIFVFLTILVVTFPHMGLLLEGYIGRLTDIEYLWQSALGRIFSFQYGMELFLNNPLFGAGFGSIMNLVWITGEISSEGLFIDNAFAAILAKTGITGGLPFLFLSLTPLGLLISLIRNTSDKGKRTLYKGFFWTYPSLWFSLTMSSAHLIHSRITIILFCLFLAFLSREYMNVRDQRCHEV